MVTTGSPVQLPYIHPHNYGKHKVDWGLQTNSGELSSLVPKDVLPNPCVIIYCILRGQIKGFNSAIYAIKCQEVVIELWLGSYRTIE